MWGKFFGFSSEQIRKMERNMRNIYQAMKDDLEWFRHMTMMQTVPQDESTDPVIIKDLAHVPLSQIPGVVYLFMRFGCELWRGPDKSFKAIGRESNVEVASGLLKLYVQHRLTRKEKLEDLVRSAVRQQVGTVRGTPIQLETRIGRERIEWRGNRLDRKLWSRLPHGGPLQTKDKPV